MTTWLVDARTLSCKPTGIGMYAFRLLKKLIAEVPDARLVLVSDVAESVELRDLERLGCEVRTYGRRVFKSWAVVGYFRWVRRQVAEVRPDVFWQPNNLQPFRVRGVRRVIVTMHDTFGLGWSRRYWLWHLYYRFNFWRTLRNVTEIWYNSAQTQREVRERIGSGKWAEKVTRPIAEVPARESVAPWKWSHPYFLYVGNVETRKGADLLVAAYRQYRAACKTATCDLVIAGAERNVHVPDEPGIIKLGYVGDEVKFSLMKSCAAFVVPSRAEGYGMQLAEALKLGTKVIVSDLSVFKEVVNEQGTLFQDVTWLKGFSAGEDGERVKMVRDTLSAVQV